MKYTIRAGDTLSELAVRFNTTVDSLAHANDIPDPNKIYAGVTIEVPGIAFTDDPWNFDLWQAIKRLFSGGS